MQAMAIDYESGFDDAFRSGIGLLPKVGYFLLILILGILLAKLVQGILTKVLQKAGFDRLVERGGVKQALSQSRYDAAAVLARIVYYFIFLAVLSMAFSVFGPNPISDFLSQIINFLPRLFTAILVLVIAAAVAAAVKDLLTNMLGGLSYGAALARAASLVVVALGVFFALDLLQIAPLIVGGIFYALLALIVIPPIIAFGVGGIDPARETIRGLQARSRGTAQELQREVQQPPAAPAAPAPPAAPAAANVPAAAPAEGVPATRVRRTRASAGTPPTPRRPRPRPEGDGAPTAG